MKTVLQHTGVSLLWAYHRVRPFILYVIILFMAIGVVLFTVSGWIDTIRRPPSLQYDQLSYIPEVVNLCPGEFLVYTNTLTISRSEGIYTGRSWLHGQGKDAVTVIPLRLGDMAVSSFLDVPVTRTNTWHVLIPKLPPGPGEMHYLATNFKDVDSVHRVTFVIRNDCPTSAIRRETSLDR